MKYETRNPDFRDFVMAHLEFHSNKIIFRVFVKTNNGQPQITQRADVLSGTRK